MDINIKRIYKLFTGSQHDMPQLIKITKKDIASGQPPGGPWQNWVTWGDYLWYHGMLTTLKKSKAKYKITDRTTKIAGVITTMAEEDGVFKCNTSTSPVSRKQGGKVKRIEVSSK